MKKNLSASIYQKIGKVLIIFTKAVRKAQEENRKLGLPNVYCENGEIFYQLPSGKITKRVPKSLLQISQGRNSTLRKSEISATLRLILNIGLIL